MSKRKRKKDTKIFLKSIIIIGVALAILFLVWFVGNKDKFPILGEYVNVNNDEKLIFTIHEWTKGERENLKCSLWNCTDYHHGTYKINGDLIIFELSEKSHSYETYELKEENGITYLILKENDTVVDKYKKVK